MMKNSLIFNNNNKIVISNAVGNGTNNQLHFIAFAQHHDWDDDDDGDGDNDGHLRSLPILYLYILQL